MLYSMSLVATDLRPWYPLVEFKTTSLGDLLFALKSDWFYMKNFDWLKGITISIHFSFWICAEILKGGGGGGVLELLNGNHLD